MTSHTTKEFWNLFDTLPKDIQSQAVKAYVAWNNTLSIPAFISNPFTVQNLFTLFVSVVVIGHLG
jgi:hypothetical protein